MTQTSKHATIILNTKTYPILDMSLPKMHPPTLILPARVRKKYDCIFTTVKSIGKQTIILITRLILFYTAHCEEATFDVGIQTYDALSKISINEEGNNRAISIYYATTDVKVSTTSEVIDFPTFISNVGGNLGLFVEFSILGGLFFIYDFLAARFSQ